MDNLPPFEDWLKKLNHEISSLFHHLDLFKTLNEILQSNNDLKSMDGTLLDWMKTSFTVELVIGIGRICDTDKRTDSLARFLKELEQRPDYLTRDRYLSLWPKAEGDRFFANKGFDGLGGIGANNFPADVIASDIAALTEKEPIKKVIGFRNQYIAHNDRSKDLPPPTYDELFGCFDIIEPIFKKYYLLILATNIVKLTPTIQGNWQDVLTIPWISSEPPVGKS